MGSLYVTSAGFADYMSTRAQLPERADDLFAVLKSGAVHVQIHQRYPLADAARAHRDLEGRRTMGELYHPALIGSSPTALRGWTATFCDNCREFHERKMRSDSVSVRRVTRPPSVEVNSYAVDGSGRQPVVKVWRRTETGEAPRGQGATTENIGNI